MLTTTERRRRIAFIKAAATAALLAIVFTPKVDLPALVVPFVSVAVAAPMEGVSSGINEPMSVGSHRDEGPHHKKWRNYQSAIVPWLGEPLTCEVDEQEANNAMDC